MVGFYYAADIRAYCRLFCHTQTSPSFLILLVVVFMLRVTWIASWMVPFSGALYSNLYDFLSASVFSLSIVQSASVNYFQNEIIALPRLYCNFYMGMYTCVVWCVYILVLWWFSQSIMMIRSARYDEHPAIPWTAAAHVDLKRLQNESIFSLSKSCAIYLWHWHSGSELTRARSQESHAMISSFWFSGTLGLRSHLHEAYHIHMTWRTLAPLFSFT